MNFNNKSENKNPESINPFKADEPSNMDKVKDKASDLAT